jgi:ABC-type branched-subunit amino acid transport system ATPase component
LASARGELPYGRKRALEIATTLALDPVMMLLDEPTAGMGARMSTASRPDPQASRPAAPC